MIGYGKEKDECHFDCIIHLIDTHRFSSEAQVLNGKECPDLDCDASAATLRCLIDLIEKEPKDFEPSELNCECSVKNNVPGSIPKALNTKLPCSSLYQSSHINSNIPYLEVGACIEVLGETDSDSKYSSISEPFSDRKSSVDEKELLIHSSSHCTEDLDIGANILVNSEENDVENYPNHINQSVLNALITNDVTFTAGTYANNQKEQLQHTPYIEDKVDKIDRCEGSELHSNKSDFDHLMYITYTDENFMRIRQIDETDLKVANEISNNDNSVNENKILPNNLEYNSPGRSLSSDSKVINVNNCHEAVIKEPDNTLEQEKYNGVCFNPKTSPPIINSETYAENLKMKNFQNYETSGFNIFANIDENAEKDAKLNPVSNTDRKQIIEPKDAENVQKLVPCASAMPTLHKHKKFECVISEPTTPKQFSQSSDLVNEAINTLNDMLNEKDEKHSILVEISDSDRKIIVADPKESDSCIEPPVNSNVNPVLDENVKDKHLEVHVAQLTTPVSSDEDSNSYDLNSEYIQLMSPPPSFLSDLKQPNENPSVKSKLPDVENYQENGNDGKSDFIKIRKNSITIQQILKEREEQKKYQEKITILQQKFQNEEQSNVEDDFSDDDERRDFLNSKKCLAEQESQSSIIQEDRTNNPPPGLNIFGKDIFSYFTYQDITLKNCGYTNSGLTKFEEMLLSLPSVTLSENLPSILNNYQLYNVTNHNSFLLYLFKMAAVNDPLSVSCCEKTIKRICCDNDPKANISWCPPPVNILEVFLNYGIDTEVQCPLRNALQKVENNLIGQTHGFQSNSKEKSKIRNCLPKNCRWSATNANLDSTLNILSTLIDNCCLYSDEELCDIIILLLWISLDRNILGTKTEVKIEKCIASAMKQISPKSWKIQAEILAGTICSLSQHHRNILNIINLLPISVQRERKLKQAASYLALQILLDCEKKVFVPEIKLDLILHLLKNKQLHKIQDFYLLHTIASLVDFCVGHESHHDQVDILDRLGVYFVNTHSKIADDARYPESTQVKSYLIRIQCKWKMLNSRLEGQKNLYMHTNKTSVEAVNQEVKKISTENNGNSVVEEELKKLPLVDSTPDVDMNKNVNAGMVLESEITIEKTENDLNDSSSDEMVFAKIFDSLDGNTLGEEDMNNLDFNYCNSNVAEDKLSLEHYIAQNTDSDDENVMDKIFSCQNIQTEILDLNTKFSDNKTNGAFSNSHKLEQRNKNTDSSNDSDDEKVMDQICTGPEAQKFLEEIKLNTITSRNHRTGVSEKYTVTENMSSKNEAITEYVKHVNDNSIGMGEMKVLPEKLDQIGILNDINTKSVTESFNMKNNIMNYVDSKDMPSVPFQHISTKSLSSNICKQHTEVRNELHCRTSTFDRNEGNPNTSRNTIEFVADKQSDTPTMDYFQKDSDGGNNKPVCTLSVPVAQEFELLLDDNSNNTEFSLESITDPTHIKMEEYLNIDNQDAIEHVNITADENERSPKSEEPLPRKFLRTADNFEILGTTNLKDLSQPVTANTDSKQTTSLQMEMYSKDTVREMEKSETPIIDHSKGNPESGEFLCKELQEANALDDLNISCKDLPGTLNSNSNANDFLHSSETESLLAIDFQSKDSSPELSSFNLENQSMEESVTHAVNHSKLSPGSNEFLNISEDLTSVNCKDFNSLVTNSKVKDFVHSSDTGVLLGIDLMSKETSREISHLGNQAVAESTMPVDQGIDDNANYFLHSSKTESLSAIDFQLKDSSPETSSFNLENQSGEESVTHAVNHSKVSPESNEFLNKELSETSISEDLTSVNCTNLKKSIVTNSKVENFVHSSDTGVLLGIDLMSKETSREISHLGNQAVAESTIPVDQGIDDNANDSLHSSKTESLSAIDFQLKDSSPETSSFNLGNQSGEESVTHAVNHSKVSPEANEFLNKELPETNISEDLTSVNCTDLKKSIVTNSKVENFVHSSDTGVLLGIDLMSKETSREISHLGNQAVAESTIPVDQGIDDNANDFLHSSKTESLSAIDFQLKDSSPETSSFNLENQSGEESVTHAVNHSKVSPETNEFLNEELPETNISEDLTSVNCTDLKKSIVTNSKVKDFVHSSDTGVILGIDLMSKETSREISHLDLGNQAVAESTMPVDQGIDDNANDFLHSSKTESLSAIDFQLKDSSLEPSSFNLENQSVEESVHAVNHSKVSPESSESTMPVDQGIDGGQELNGYLCEELPATTIPQCLNSDNYGDSQDPSVENSNANDNSKQETSLIANNAEDLSSSKNANTSLQLDMCAEVANENCINRLENECSNKYIQEPIDCHNYTNTINNVRPSEVIDLCDSDSCSTIFLTESDDDDCVIESIKPRDQSNVIVIDFTDEESGDI